jgi:hypothetical protein
MLVVERGVALCGECNHMRQELLHTNLWRLDHVHAKVVGKHARHYYRDTKLKAAKDELGLKRKTKDTGMRR